MLEVKNFSLHVENADGETPLLSHVTAHFPLSHYAAIIGPSGCGKTSLLKLIAGIAPGREEGEITWRGNNLADSDFHASEIAYVPQFGIAHEELTILESVRFALALRRCRTGRSSTSKIIDSILAEVGLTDLREQQVKKLSGGQRRRLALAIELTSQPAILLCDEVTSGLDPQAEEEIVHLLRRQSRENGRLVLSVTHSLAHLDLYDTVLVLYGGMVAYHGPPRGLPQRFRIESPHQLYAILKQRHASDWNEQWRAQPREAYPDFEPSHSPAPSYQPPPIPGPVSQFWTLLARRTLIFRRSTSQLLLQMALLLGFPLLVAIFAWNGLPAIQNLSMGLQRDVFVQMTERQQFLENSTRIGSIVSGIVMFQVILLSLMGANNAGREIASERAIFEKERLAGLRPLAYVASKATFLSFIVIPQSLWMGCFIHFACQFPGDLPTQLGFLLLINSAISSLCLGISSLMPNAEQASLLSIYLVGFQLPLSGAVLALPEPLDILTRPFISAYWSWSGILETLHQERYYDVVQSVVQSPLASIPICIFTLLSHILTGLAAAWIGCEHQHTP